MSRSSDTTSMMTEAHRKRAALMGLMIILACPILALRWIEPAETRPNGRSPADDALCAVFAQGDGPPILVCAPSKTALAPAAIAVNALPGDCEHGDLPASVEACHIVNLHREGGRCTIEVTGKVRGAGRLLCGGRIDINEANHDDLVLLPSIGPTRAAKIIRHRERLGPFSAPEDLTEISGIGEKTVAALRPWVEI